MARITGVDIPKDKWAGIALGYIHGIGPHNVKEVLAKAGVDPWTKVNDLTESEVNRLREVINRECKVEGELRRAVSLDIKRLIEIGCYRGIRHRKGLPVRGQRTRTNARTKRGAHKTVAGRGRRRGVGKK